MLQRLGRCRRLCCVSQCLLTEPKSQLPHRSTRVALLHQSTRRNGSQMIKGQRNCYFQFLPKPLMNIFSHTASNISNSLFASQFHSYSRLFYSLSVGIKEHGICVSQPQRRLNSPASTSEKNPHHPHFLSSILRLLNIAWLSNGFPQKKARDVSYQKMPFPS